MLTHGEEMAIAELSQAPLTATLQRIDLAPKTASVSKVEPGSALLIKLTPGMTSEKAGQALKPYRSSKAALVIVSSSDYGQHAFDAGAKQPPRINPIFGDQAPEQKPAFVVVKPEQFEKLWAEPEGTSVTLEAELTPWKTSYTWNVVAKLEGTTLKEQIILLSAHLDHLGVQDGKTYYGADDDASGTAAVMELARVLAQQPQPKRAVVFALWGSEEIGLLGSSYFLRYPTFPLQSIVAYLEFEMIGRPDPKINPDQLWLTGWKRTNLGPALVKHGAKLVADPHPTEKFFTRSDNYAFAKEGIVAQTISSYGLHPDYHQPTDTVDKIDFQHMDAAIASMIAPLTWLANTQFKPEWVEGKKP